MDLSERTLSTIFTSSNATVTCFVLLAIFFVFLIIMVMGEAAITTFSDIKLKKLKEENDNTAILIAKITDKPTKFKNIAFISIIFLIFLTTFCFAKLWIDKSYVWLYNSIKDHIPLYFIEIIIFSVSIIVGSFFVIVLGVIFPKHLAIHYPERVSRVIIRPFSILMKLFSPIAFLIEKSSGGLARIFGADPNHQPKGVTEEEIRMLVDVGEEEGVIEESQKEMINNIFEFDDTTAEELMTHRVDIVAVSDNSDIKEIIDCAINEGFSRIPVFKEDIDNIIGIVYAKDLLQLIGKDNPQELDIKKFIHSAIYVPESTKCRDLFRQFTEKKAHMAVVVDEYGGTSGIVTMEDLLESIVGNIQDEYDDEQEEITKINDTTFEIDGGADLEDVSKALGISIEENSDYESLGGFIVDILGRIPDENENPTIVYQNVEFTVLIVEDRHISRIRAVILPEIEMDSPQESKE